MKFSRQKYWSGLPFHTPGDLPNPGIEPSSLTSPALAGGFFTTSTTWEALQIKFNYFPRLDQISLSNVIPSLFSESESEVAQSCPTLFDPMYCSLPGSSVHGILQARIPEWIAISFSRGSSQPRDRTPCLLHLLHWQADSLPLCHRGSLWTPREVTNFSKITCLIRNSAGIQVRLA